MSQFLDKVLDQFSSKGYFLSLQLPLKTIVIVGSIVLALSGSETLAVKAGEMRESVNYVTALLDNNIVPLILAGGVAGGAAFAFLKQNFTPLIMSLMTSVGYGFGNKWISTVYSLCI